MLFYDYKHNIIMTIIFNYNYIYDKKLLDISKALKQVSLTKTKSIKYPKIHEILL